MVLEEFDNLPVVDDRYRLWPWSLRALARRRGTSPGTVHKHVQALRAAGVLVDDTARRTLVDTIRLSELARPGIDGLAAERAVPAGRVERGGPADVGANLVRAIDALTTVLEARLDEADAVAEIIGRLAALLAGTGEPDVFTTARVCATNTIAQARDRAPIKARETELHWATDQENLSPLSPTSARRALHGDGRAPKRSVERLLELLAPLDPAQHVSYTEGVVAALAKYDDYQVAYAVSRAAKSSAANPVGLLVDRAKKRDPIFFPVSDDRRGRAPKPAHGQDCVCEGTGLVQVDAGVDTYLPCTGAASVQRLAS
jgi:hypothetical protein